MHSIENLNQAQHALNQYITPRSGAIRYTLERMSALMDLLDNPQDTLKIIHVAGTSGKTSTAYYVASLLREAGYSVGLTVSPHINTVDERAQINLIPLNEDEYCKELSKFLDLIDTSGLAPSYFEIVIAFAFWLFHTYRVDFAVIEVGFGGLLDSTNIIDRADKVCVITDIGFDHTEILGNTLHAIALQKAGIIQPHNTVFMHDQEKEVTSVVKKVCQEKNAQLHIVQSDYQDNRGAAEKLPLFQQRNFQLALQVVRSIMPQDGTKKLTLTNIRKASTIYIPARMEIVLYRGKTLILDGSHNEQKIKALVGAMRVQFPNTPMTLLVSFGKNKQATTAASLLLLRQLSTTIIITKFGAGQEGIGVAIDPQLLAVYAKDAKFTTIILEPNPIKAFKLLERDTATIGVITGSFYLLNHFLSIILGSEGK